MTNLIDATHQGHCIILTFATPHQDISPSVNRLRADLIANIEIPGFCKGKVPEAVLKKHIDIEMLEARLLDATMDPLARHSYDLVVEECEKISPDYTVFDINFEVMSVACKDG